MAGNKNERNWMWNLLRPKWIIVIIGALVIVVVFIYLLVDMGTLSDYLFNTASSRNNNTKQDFMEVYKGKYKDGIALDDDFQFATDKPWDGSVSIDADLFNTNQIELNKRIINAASTIWTSEHLERTSISLNNNFMQSFYDNMNPLVQLSAMSFEWGGHTTLKQAFAPLLAFKDLDESGYDIFSINDFSFVNKQFYLDNLDIELDRTGKAKGPLQIIGGINHIKTEYPQCMKQTDVYNPYDAMEWYWHAIMDSNINKQSYFQSDYQIKNVYQALSIHSYIGSGMSQINGHKYNGSFAGTHQWLQDSEGRSYGVFEYIDKITSPESIAIIKGEASRQIEVIEDNLKAGRYNNNLQINANKADEIRCLVVPDMSTYVHSDFVDGLNDKVFTNNTSHQAANHPIYLIYSYIMLEHFINGGDGGA